jgi:hypothetical protein
MIRFAPFCVPVTYVSTFEKFILINGDKNSIPYYHLNTKAAAALAFGGAIGS